jgi:hypothetical protein
MVSPPLMQIDSPARIESIEALVRLHNAQEEDIDKHAVVA